MTLGKSRARVLALLVAATSCGILAPDDLVCLTIPVDGILIYVKDSATRAWAASGAHFTARSGDYVDSTTYPSRFPLGDSLPMRAASGQAGIFSVTVRKEGYRDWTRTGIWVGTNKCGEPRTVTVTALLQRPL